MPRVYLDHDCKPRGESRSTSARLPAPPVNMALREKYLEALISALVRDVAERVPRGAS